MKNIHILPTDKPSRLHYYSVLNFGVSKENLNWKQGRHIYITSDDEIKEGDWFIHKTNADCSLHKCIDRPAKQNVIGDDNIDYFLGFCKKIILTTDQELINDGVQAIDTEFLKWFVKNPSCESIEVKDWYNKFLSCCRSKEECHCNKKRIIIPQEELKQETNLDKHLASLPEYSGSRRSAFVSKQETLEEASWRFNPLKKLDGEFLRAAFIKGARWQSERMYSEEEVIDLLQKMNDWPTTFDGRIDIKEWFEQFKNK